MEKEIKKNDITEVDITGYTSEGSGVGHVNGMAVFVAGAAAGSTVEALIIKAKSNYAVGKLKSVIKQSGDAAPPDCSVFPRCGGCVFRHITYEAELRHKEQRVKDAFARIGHLDVTPEPIAGAGSPARYRNKAQYPVCMANGRLAAGFYAPFSHRVIDCKDCLLQPENFAAILRAVARWAEKYKIPTYDESTGKGLLRHVYL
ncbi:MAG: class I SAM-dependent RNA methyltransferase, partial [Clostridia bacterium]|nr:class I SAM-dependent RNA methyltransferase [Clostridia bacterium]